MAAGGGAIFLAVSFLLFETTWFSIVSWEKSSGIESYQHLMIVSPFQSMAVLSIGILLGAYQFMVFMCRPSYSESGALLDSGSDLNMEGAISEWD